MYLALFWYRISVTEKYNFSGKPETFGLHKAPYDANINTHAGSERCDPRCPLRELPGTMHFANITTRHEGTRVKNIEHLLKLS